MQARDIGAVNFVAAPLTTLNGLSPSVTSFVVRDDESAELAGQRFVVVSGLGGIGKTELVLRFAERNDFPGEHSVDDILRAGERFISSLTGDRDAGNDWHRQVCYLMWIADSHPADDQEAAARYGVRFRQVWS